MLLARAARARLPAAAALARRAPTPQRVLARPPLLAAPQRFVACGGVLDVERLRRPPHATHAALLPLRLFSSRAADAYATLGVARGLADKDYKVAYLKQAKVWHPDLRPGDPEATRKFQELSAAYEQIKDQRLRAAYDARRTWGGGGERASGPFDANRSAQEAAATWAEAYDDAGALFEAGRAWWSDECAALDDDAHDFAMAASERRLGDAWVIAQRRSGLIVGVAVPLVILLRWPGAALAVIRGAAPLVTAALGVAARLFVQNPRLVPVFTGLIRQFGGRYWTTAVNRARAKLRERDARKGRDAAWKADQDRRRDEARRRAHAQDQHNRRRGR